MNEIFTGFQKGPPCSTRLRCRGLHSWHLAPPSAPVATHSRNSMAQQVEVGAIQHFNLLSSFHLLSPSFHHSPFGSRSCSILRLREQAAGPAAAGLMPLSTSGWPWRLSKDGRKVYQCLFTAGLPYPMGCRRWAVATQISKTYAHLLPCQALARVESEGLVHGSLCA